MKFAIDTGICRELKHHCFQECVPFNFYDLYDLSIYCFNLRILLHNEKHINSSFALFVIGEGCATLFVGAPYSPL